MDLNTKTYSSNILQLPTELLMKIFQLIPFRWKISLVCQKFYKIVCSIERNKLSLNNEKMLLDKLTFNSIMNTNRELKAVKMIITTKLTHLCWDRLAIIFKKFDFESLQIVNYDPRRETHAALIQILMKLDSNTVHEMNLSNIDLDYLKEFFQHQSTIEKISLTGQLGDSSFLNNIKLKSLKLIGPKCKNLENIIKTQSKLISLKITTDAETDFNDEVFTAIVNLDDLESLDIPLNNNLSLENIKNLSNLSHLLKLSVCCSQSYFRELSTTKIPSLTDFDVSFNEPITNESMQSLTQHIPNLKKIKLKGPLVVNFLKFLANFEKLESVWIENDESYFVNILNLKSPVEEKTKLKHLHIINHDRKVVICANNLIKFLKMLPNLITLVITKNIEIRLNNCENLLKHLPNLEELIIDTKLFTSTTKIMNVIKLHGKSLKFIKLENFRNQAEHESLSVFFEGKFSLVEKKDGNLILSQMEKSSLIRSMD